MTETVLMLHGFAQTHRAWDGVRDRLPAERYRPLPIDLLGHGEAWRQPPAGFAAAVRAVLDRAPDRFLLAGYSLGGRLALHVALAAPERVRGLVLVSTTAGLAEEAQRAERRRSDARLALELEEGDFEGWIARWRAQPLFAEDPPEVRETAMRDMRRNRPGSLAAVLRALGSGEMEPLWGRLAELTMPAVALAGRRDERYLALAGRLADALPRGRLMLADGGHSLLLECPGAVAEAIVSCVRGS